MGGALAAEMEALSAVAVTGELGIALDSPEREQESVMMLHADAFIQTTA